MTSALAQIAARAAIERAAGLVLPALDRGDELTLAETKRLVEEATKLHCAALQLERIALGLPAPRRGDG